MRAARLFLVLVVLIVILHDWSAPPANDYGVRAAVFAIDQYRGHVSPALSKFSTCRFTPSCSRYGRAVLLKHGVPTGVTKIVWRIARCGPWTKKGTVDLP
jgi:putative component of membrane protein insertase Oxa1/YidC/SpoIIIJ protein YidD